MSSTNSQREHEPYFPFEPLKQEEIPKTLKIYAREIKEKIRTKADGLLGRLGFNSLNSTTQNSEDTQTSEIRNTAIFVNDYLEREQPSNYSQYNDVTKALLIRKDHIKKDKTIALLREETQELFDRLRQPLSTDVNKREQFYVDFLSRVNTSRDPLYAQQLFESEKKEFLAAEKKFSKGKKNANSGKREKPPVQTFSIQGLSQQYLDANGKNGVQSVFRGINTLLSQAVPYDTSVREFCTQNLTYENLEEWSKHRNSTTPLQKDVNSYSMDSTEFYGNLHKQERTQDRSLLLSSARANKWQGETRMEEPSTQEYFANKYGTKALGWHKLIKNFQIDTAMTLLSNNLVTDKQIQEEIKFKYETFVRHSRGMTKASDYSELISYLWDLVDQTTFQHEREQYSNLLFINGTVPVEPENLLTKFDVGFIRGLSRAIAEEDKKEFSSESETPLEKSIPRSDLGVTLKDTKIIGQSGNSGDPVALLVENIDPNNIPKTELIDSKNLVAIFNETNKARGNFSRRKFLKLMAFAGASYLFGAPILSDMTKNLLYSKDYLNAVKSVSQDLRDRYNVKIYLNEVNELLAKHVIYTEADVVSLFELINNLNGVIQQYPMEAIKKTALNISLVGTLNQPESPFFIKGIISDLKGKAISSPSHAEIVLRSDSAVEHILPVEFMAGGDPSKVERETIHHELSHVIDIQTSTSDDNTLWENLNPQKYEGYSLLSDMNPIRPIGFARGYGQTNIREDKATVAELMMTNLNLAMQLAQTDPIFKGKIELIKKMYFKWSNGAMDDLYWEKLQNWQNK